MFKELFTEGTSFTGEPSFSGGWDIATPTPDTKKDEKHIEKILIKFGIDRQQIDINSLVSVHSMGATYKTVVDVLFGINGKVQLAFKYSGASLDYYENARIKVSEDIKGVKKISDLSVKNLTKTFDNLSKHTNFSDPELRQMIMTKEYNV